MITSSPNRLQHLFVIFTTVLILTTAAGVHSVFSQTTTTIGTGTATQKQPFGMYYGYERSAAIYTGTFNYIQSLGWYVGTGYPVTCPVKIYLKPTTATTVTVTTWEVMKSGATLVFDAMVSFPSSGWQTIDIADFASTSSGLLVLCETNYGGIGTSSYPVFRYSIATNTHEYWQGDDPPTGNGTRNNNRPNIQITHVPMGSPVPPSGLMAVASGAGQIDLTWKKNLANDNVMVAVNTENTFGNPSGSYVAGNSISGGGTVIYNGALTSYSHNAGLSPSTTYYYKAWSVHAPTPTYSIGTVTYAMTWCDVLSQYPYSVDFELAQFPPACWSTAGTPPSRSVQASGYGTGSAAAVFDFLNVVSGNFDLISPEISIGSLSNPTVQFDHAYATYAGEVDELQLWYSTNGGTSYSLLATWLGGTSGPLNTGGSVAGSFVPTPAQWASKTTALPAGTNRLMFRGVSMHGNFLYLDNILISGSCTPANTPTASITPSGPTTICQGNSVDLTASGGTVYYWSTGSSSASINVTSAGIYTVTVTNTSGCTDSESTSVSVTSGGTVEILITPDANPVEAGEQVTFSSNIQNGGPAPVYQWRINNQVSGSNSPTLIYAPENNDTVYCILTSNGLCVSGNPDTSNIVIMEVVPTPELALTSPNGGENWSQGSQQQITWYDNFTEPVKLELFKAGEFISIIASSVPSTGQYEWTIPVDQKPGNDYSVRISSTLNVSLSDESDQSFVISGIIPANILVQNVLVENGMDTCLNATQTITLGGGGSYFTVQPGGSALCIAGQRILIFPGTVVSEGAYLSAYISETGDYCDLTSAPEFKDISVLRVKESVRDLARVCIYPNPSHDHVNILVDEPNAGNLVKCSIFGADGRLLVINEFESGMVFRLPHHLTSGLYLVLLEMPGRNFYTKMVVSK